MNKKYIFFIPRLGAGGAERVIATLASKLASLNNDVTIFTITSDISFYKLHPNVKVLGVNSKIDRSNVIKKMASEIILSIKTIYSLKKVVNREKPDFLISFLTHTNILAILIKLFSSDLKLILSERCDPLERNLAIRIVTKYFYPYADAIVCQSKKVTTFFPPFAKNKIEIIKNPVSEVFLDRPIAPIKRKAVVAVGRLFEQKNFKLLINSFSDISKNFPEYKLEIYGEGHLRNDLETQISKLNLNDKVELMGLKEDISSYIYDASLFVMSSNYEGFPNALVEAMALGLPVISTDFPTGVAKEIVKEENGIIVPLNNREELVRAMSILLNDEIKKESMSKANKAISQELSENNIFKEWDSLFSRIQRGKL
ncbi:glycosyltransferase family 4 protein [Exiguobacterium alkaliphilum]|uniref:glycosyltransferase family 4 protein n=1 Tax=Exiguobacterium alkaliphilum TaxID=1428684 RepID=UPI00403AB9DB